MAHRNGPVVAVDGPAGAGKSTVARAVARRAGLIYLDTGALYRSIGWKARAAGVDADDPAAMAALCAALSIAVERVDGEQRIYVDGVDVTDEIRTPEMSRLASRVSRHPVVRERLLGLQRELGAHGGVILDGRDIGTVVFPDAELKIYLDAAPEVRARRRHVELAGRGDPASYEETLNELTARDLEDRSRAVAPLMKAPDAVVLDTTQLSPDDVVERICQMVAAARRS